MKRRRGIEDRVCVRACVYGGRVGGLVTEMFWKEGWKLDAGRDIFGLF